MNQSELEAPWVKLFKDNRKIDEEFKLLNIAHNPSEVTLEENDMEDVEVSWGYYLVGYFAERF